MKKIYTLLFIIIMFVSACTGKKIDIEQKTVEPAVCVIMIDGTRSYEYLDKAKDTVKKVIAGLPSGSKIYIRWITENSRADKNAIASAQFVKIVKQRNAFDMREKQRFAMSIAKVKKQRQEIFEALSGAVSPRSMRTDIYGALAAASARFEGNSDMKPLLVLLTDMNDNINKTDLSISLNNAIVRILNFQVGQDDEQLKSYWKDYLLSKGAIKVDFAYLDDPYEGGE